MQPISPYILLPEIRAKRAVFVRRWRSSTVYCPKCEKNIKKERLADVNRQLKEKFGKDSLEKGQCPVCGTALLDLDKKKR